MTTNTTTVRPYTTALAEALALNATDHSRGHRITADEVGGVAILRNWKTAIDDLLGPAYVVYSARIANMSESQACTANLGYVYQSLKPIIAAIGDVNGAPLLAQNLAEPIIAAAWVRKEELVSDEAKRLHALCKSLALDVKYAKTDAEAETAQRALDIAKAQVKELHAVPGNYKWRYEAKTAGAFRTEVEVLIGKAITKQMARPWFEIVNERKALEEARKAKRAANKKAKRAAANAQ